MTPTSYLKNIRNNESNNPKKTFFSSQEMMPDCNNVEKCPSAAMDFMEQHYTLMDSVE